MIEYRFYQINDMRLHAVARRNDLGFMNFSVAIEADEKGYIPGNNPQWGHYTCVAHSFARGDLLNTHIFAYLPAGGYRAETAMFSTNSEHAWDSFERYLGRSYGYDSAKHVCYLMIVPIEPEPIDPYKQANLDADLLMQLDEIEVTLTRLESERNALDVSYHAAVGQWRTVNAAISPARRRRV